MIRHAEHNGVRYVSVTSAMQYVKTIIGEKPDYYGPDAAIHAAEGEGCHQYCLNWIAFKHGFLPEYHVPEKPSIHPDEVRWREVLDRSLYAFHSFETEFSVDPIGIEQVDFSKAYGLVGHIDLPCYFTIPGRRRMKGPIDLKFTRSITESHRLQVRCYGRLDGMKGSQIGCIFQCNRDTGKWVFEPVDLTKNLDDVAAVSYAAKLWAWNEERKCIYL